MKVEINHLTKVIQGNVVLDDINACFSCASGENGGRIYGIQGINGSGKTMLMRVICGLVLPLSKTALCKRYFFSRRSISPETTTILSFRRFVLVMKSSPVWKLMCSTFRFLPSFGLRPHAYSKRKSVEAVFWKNGSFLYSIVSAA